MGNYILSEEVIGNFEWQTILFGCKMYGKTLIQVNPKIHWLYCNYYNAID